MKFRCNFLVGVLTVFIPSVGCTHVQLRRNSVRQANTVSDIYEQQVLDNLAKFVVNPYATPSFSVASQSTNGVQDEGEFAISDGGFVGKFWAHFSTGGSRGVEENFTLNPVTSPQRLKLMQCAYQRAVGLHADECNQCCEYLVAWTGDPTSCFDPCGITTGWICKADCWRDVPKGCCASVGKYCGTYVWVDPCHRQEFSKLVMAILDYAAGQPASGPGVKEVTYYLNEFGQFAPEGTHVQEVHAIVSAADDQQKIERDLQLSLLHANTTTKELARAAVKNAPDIDALKLLAPNLKEFLPNAQIDESMKNKDFEKLRAELLNEIDNSFFVVPSSIPAVASPPQPFIRSIDFGPPTQFNSPLGGGVLQQQQILNTVPFSRRSF